MKQTKISAKEIPRGHVFLSKKRGRKRGNTLRAYLYALKAWAEKRKHPAGIPLCPKSVGGKEETPCGHTFMP